MSMRSLESDSMGSLLRVPAQLPVDDEHGLVARSTIARGPRLKRRHVVTCPLHLVGMRNPACVAAFGQAP